MPGKSERLSSTDLLKVDAGGNGYGKSVHGQGHGYSQGCDYMHGGRFRVGFDFSWDLHKGPYLTKIATARQLLTEVS